jgi:hypothetical protein
VVVGDDEVVGERRGPRAKLVVATTSLKGSQRELAPAAIGREGRRCHRLHFEVALSDDQWSETEPVSGRKRRARERLEAEQRRWLFSGAVAKVQLQEGVEARQRDLEGDRAK